MPETVVVRRNVYVVIPERVIRDLESGRLDATSFAALAFLAFCDQNSRDFPAEEELARILGVAPEKITEVFRRLVACGYMVELGPGEWGWAGLSGQPR